jgi:MOSC domain-containing protein YiiM
MSVSGSPHILSVNVARMRLIQLGGQTVKTGIYKYPVEGRVELRDDQVGADRQGDYTVHGGRDKAVYSYSREDYEWWAAEHGLDVPPGLFGENLTTGGVELNGLEVGQRWRVGTAELEVSEPRFPCSKLGHKMEDPHFVKAFAKALRPGAYLRIVTEGKLGAGDEIEVLSTPGHGVTIELFARAVLGEPELAPRMLEAPALSASWREWAEDRAERAG